MLIKNGIDILHIERIKNIYNKYNHKFLNKFFTLKEIKYCTKNNIINFNSLAKRFAAKEAFAKALGCGIGKINFKDIEILNNELKEPYITINIKIKDYIKITYNYSDFNISLSLSDDKEYCVASVVIHMK